MEIENTGLDKLSKITFPATTVLYQLETVHFKNLKKRNPTSEINEKTKNYLLIESPLT